MDLTVNTEPNPEEVPEPQDPQLAAEAALKRRVPNLVNTVTLTVFSYIAQASDLLLCTAKAVTLIASPFAC